MNSFNDSFSKGFSQSDRWNDNWSHNRSYGDGQSMSTEGQISQSHSKMESAIQSISETTGWSHDQAKAYVTAVSGGIEVGTPKGANLLFGMSAKAGVSWSQDDRESFSKMSAEQKQALSQATEQYTEGATEMQRAGRTLDAKDNRSEVEQYAHDFALNFQRTQQTAAAVNASNADVDTLSHMQSILKNDTVNFSASAVTGFQQYLEGTVKNPNEVARLMNAYKPEDVQRVRELFNEYAHSDDFQKHYGVDTSKASLEALKGRYEPQDLSAQPTLKPEQSSLIDSGASKARAQTDEISAEMFQLNESGQLYVDSTYNNVKGNALLYAGHMQNQVESTLSSPPVETGSVETDVAQEVEPVKPTRVGSPTNTSYPLYQPPQNSG